MNRREFLGAAATLALGAAVEAVLPSRVAADTLPRMYLPVIIAKPEPPQYDERKGAVIIRSADDVAMLGAGWWYDYTPTPEYQAPGFVPMIRDQTQLAAFRDSGWSLDMIAHDAEVLFYNEQNIACQVPDEEALTPDEMAADLHEMHEARPDLRIVGPSLYYAPEYPWIWSAEELIDAYEGSYGALPLVGVQAHGIECNVSYTVQSINNQIQPYSDAGYGDLEVWITEYMKYATCYPEPESCVQVCEGVWEHFASDDRVTHMCWFPTRWNPGTGDPGGVDWTAQRLIDGYGMLTETGIVYQGLGGA